MRALLFAGIVGGSLVALACSDDPERPPPASDCNDPACLELRASQGGIGRGVGGGAAGATGSAGAGNVGAPGAGTLAGSVRVIVEPDLGLGSLDGAVEIRTSAPSGSVVSVSPSVDGSFRLEGVNPVSPLWVGVGSFDDDVTGLFMDTVQAVDGTQDGFVDLRVMRRNVMTELTQQSFLGTLAELSDQAGHAIIGFEDADGRPIAGIQVRLPGNGEASLAFDAGDIYSDLTGETSTRGAVAIVNVSAPAYPGTIVPVTADVGGTELDLNVRIARGSVTVIDVVVEP
jgi:hypothetical protein